MALSMPFVYMFSPERRSIVSRVKVCGFLPWSTWLWGGCFESADEE